MQTTCRHYPNVLSCLRNTPRMSPLIIRGLYGLAGSGCPTGTRPRPPEHRDLRLRARKRQTSRERPDAQLAQSPALRIWPREHVNLYLHRYTSAFA